MSSLHRILDILLAVLIMFVAPFLYMNSKLELAESLRCEKLERELENNIEAFGGISLTVYESMQERVESSEPGYCIDLSYSEQVCEPVYTGEGGKKHFTGRVMGYENLVTNDEILSLLYQTGSFMPRSGGSFKVRIGKRSL